MVAKGTIDVKPHGNREREEDNDWEEV